jgi:hypothetical protein
MPCRTQARLTASELRSTIIRRYEETLRRMHKVTEHKRGEEALFGGRENPVGIVCRSEMDALGFSRRSQVHESAYQVDRNSVLPH